VKFKVIITHDKEYGGYVVDVPELIGCMNEDNILKSF
jgi:predicted RNase H-like HicB family nuclease